MTMRDDQARAILRGNDRGGYTVPTDMLYPFQWNWDSAFAAWGLAAVPPARRGARRGGGVPIEMVCLWGNA